MLYTHILQYIDDTLLYARNEDELLDSLESYFKLLTRYNVKLHPGKFVLFARQLVWGGKLISAEGTRPNPQRIKTIKEMAEPIDAAELMNFVHGVAWFRGHIPYFAEISAPLYKVINEALEKYKRKTSVNARKVKLASLPSWEAARPAFKAVKEALCQSVTTAYFDPDKKTCILADANDDGWCLMVTQCPLGVERLPWDEQVGKHVLLALDSGRFRHAQLRWHTVDKEGFCFGVKVHDYSHWINGGKHPTALFTDHENLLAFFADEARPATCTKPNRDRLTRWGLNLAGLKYEIFHIKGEENRLADLGSRWGNLYASRKTTASGGLHAGPRPLLKRVLRTKPPQVSTDVKAPDLDLGKVGLLPINATTVSRADLATAQAEYSKERPLGLRKSRASPKLWVNRDGRVWVPGGDTKLKRILYALAHQGLAGHRGAKTTLSNLKKGFVWAGMDAEVKEWRKHCLNCIKLYTGDMIPRPLGSQLMAEKPGEIVSLDYIKIGASRTGYMYVLMIVDRLSRLVMFVPAGKATAVLAARSLLRWAAQHGLPRWLISDGGSHFHNQIFEKLAELMGIQHHITLAYCPWSNGSVEVCGRDLVWTLRVLTSEFRVMIDEWDLILPLVEFTTNHRERPVLGDRSALEVMTGSKPASTTNLAVWAGVKIKDAREFVARRDRVEQHCARLDHALSRLHEQVRDLEELRLRKKALKAAGRQPGQKFQVGDYVMVTAKDNQANPISPHKINVLWQGPYEVTGGEGPTQYSVRLLGDTEEATVHWRKLRRLAGPNLEPDEEVEASALHDRQSFRVERFDDWDVEDDEVDILVKWKNHDDHERTWEPLQQLVEDVPALVEKYVEEVADARLQAAYETAKAAVDATPVTPLRANATNLAQDEAGDRAERAAGRTHDE